MGFFNIKLNLLALVCITFIMQSMVAVPPQELQVEPSQTYAILCIVSFLMGTVLYVLLHKYCSYQLTPSSIPPAMNKESMEKELMEKLETMLQKIHNDKHNK